MTEVVDHLRSMRDNWKEVMKSVATNQNNPAAQSKIAGGQHNAVGYTPARRTGT